jgi:hypothetical protein
MLVFNRRGVNIEKLRSLECCRNLKILGREDRL